MSQATIYIVDDDLAMQESLRWLVESTGTPVKVFSSAQAFLDEYQSKAPGCLILDVRMPGMSGLQLQQKLNALNIILPVIVISAHGDVTMAVKAMQQGALVFLEKPFREQELLDNIQIALEKDEKNRKQAARTEKVSESIALLTEREKEVMGFIVKGKTNKEIALQYGIGVKTIEIHRSRVMDKMKAKSLSELVHMALSLEV